MFYLIKIGLKRSIIIYILSSNLFLSISWSQSVNLPLGHWAYTFLERMETKGILKQLRDGSQPFSRNKVAGFVKEIDQYVNSDPKVLTEVEREVLERLKGEFWDELKRSEMKIKQNEYEPHFYSWNEEQNYLHFDILGGGSVIIRSNEADRNNRYIYSPFYGGILRGSLWGVGIYSDNRIFTEWGSRKYVQHYQASEGYPQNVERDSSRATWDTSESYFSLEWKGIRFQMGRENLRWGPSYFGGLMLSGFAPSFDLWKVSADISWGTFTWTHGELRSDYIRKWLSAHRIEVSIIRGIDIGLGETVIYGKRGIETAYLNPLMPYIIAEHTLGDRDNVALGLDFDINRFRNLKLYSEIFIDDLFAPWEIFSDFWGNKLAFTLGSYWVDPIGFKNSGIRWEYTRIEPYVYTHHDSVNVYEHYDVGLGHFLQPNSDKISILGEYRFSLSLAASIKFYRMRHGEGDRRMPHLEEEGEKKIFLSGIVERKNRIGIELDWEILRDVRFRTEVSTVSVSNWKNVQGDNRRWNELMLMLSANW